MADNIGEFENPLTPVDGGDVNEQTNPIDPQNDDTQHGWTDPNGGNTDPHYNGDTEPVDGGEVTVVTHFGDEVVGKVDRLINTLTLYCGNHRHGGGYFYWIGSDGHWHRIWVGNGEVMLIHRKDGSVVVDIWMTTGAHHSFVIPPYHNHNNSGHGGADA